MQKYQRIIKNTLKRLHSAKTSKIIAILGARQVGKTTILTNFAAEWAGKSVLYVGDKLEDAEIWRGKFGELKNRLELDIGAPLEKIEHPVLLIFDEIQKIPEAFDNLKLIYDEYKHKIKIAISGSSSLRLLHRTSESLGGRVEIATMYPLSLAEILNESPSPIWMKRSAAKFDEIKSLILGQSADADKKEIALKKALDFGLFPEAYLQDKMEEVKILHQNYHKTYIEKDVRDLREIGNVLDFDQVWKIVHRGSGQLLSYANISRETGLAFNTVKKYVSVLAASFNISMLPPFIRNIRKRVVKSPRIFSVDPGFFSLCLDIYGEEKLVASNYIGAAFELVMMGEFLKQEKSFLSGGEPFYFRTSGGAEVDLVIEKEMELFAYEFKYADKVGISDFNGIQSLANASSARLRVGFVVSRQPYAEQFGENLFAVPWHYFCV